MKVPQNKYVQNSIQGVKSGLSSSGKFFSNKKAGFNLRSLAIGSAALLGTTAFMGSRRASEQNRLNLADRRDRLRNR